MTKKKIILCIGVLAAGTFFVNTYSVAPGYGDEDSQESFYKNNKTCHGFSLPIPNSIQDAAPRAVCLGILN